MLKEGRKDSGANQSSRLQMFAQKHTDMEKRRRRYIKNKQLFKYYKKVKIYRSELRDIQIREKRKLKHMSIRYEAGRRKSERQGDSVSSKEKKREED